MALIYTAQLDPDKNEWIRLALVDRGEPADVASEKVGSYRFDDPEGEIGVEVMIVRVGERLVQIPFSYRSAEPAEGQVVTTAEHSVLGRRWIVDAATDPQARDILRRGVAGELPQAVLEMHDESGSYLETRQPDVTLTVVGEGSGGELDLPTELDPRATVDGVRALVADGRDFSALPVARLI